MAVRLLALLWALFISTLVIADDQQIVIDVGDKIVIKVYNESDLTTRARVDKSGLINFPLLGSIVVSQKTPKQLIMELEEKLLDGFLVNPIVSVLVEEYRPFYIKGEVRTPSVYPFSVNLTVGQAIAVAGGLKDRASRSDWQIIRGKNKQEITAEQDTKVLPGDIIIISSSLF